MSTATGPGERTAASESPSPADVFVVFGITGDLARVMTFHSLYRLERRGLLDCPIVGVAGDDWTVEHLREHARECIEARGETIDDEVFERFAARLSYSRGDFADAGHLRAASPKRSATPSSPVFYLEIPPSLFGMVIKGLADAGLTDVGAGRGGEAVRARRRLGARAQRRGPPVPGRVPALPDRPLPRQDGPRRDPLPAVREHDVRADLEPQLRRVGADHDGRELRRGGPRPLLRPGRRAARRRRQPPHAGGRGDGDGAAGQQRRDDPQERDGLGLPGDAGGRSGPLRPRAVRRLPRYRRRARRTRRPRPTPRCASRSTTGAGRACRSSSAPASTCRSRRRSCGSSSSDPPRLRFGAAGVRRPSPTSWWSGSTRPPASSCWSTRSAPTRSKPEQITLDMEFAAGGRRGRDALRGAAARRDGRRQQALHAPGRRRADAGGSCSRCSTRPRRCTPYAKGSWGPAAADELVAGHGTLARPLGGAHERAPSEKPPSAQSAAAPSPFPPIADYAFLSNCHTGALVAPDGVDRLALRAALRLAERVRHAARPAGRRVPAGAVRDQRPGGANLRARDEHPR